MVRFCPQCGKKNEGWKFCPDCGCNLDDGAAADISLDGLSALAQEAADRKRAEENKFVIENGVLVRYNGNDEHLVIPDGVRVIANCMPTESRERIRSVRFPNSLCEIQESAFYGCALLEKLEFPPSLATIGGRSFQGCSSLQSIRFGGNAVALGMRTDDLHWGGYVFASCTQLKEVSGLGRGSQIGSNVFENCAALGSFDFSAVQSVGERAFKDSGLKEVSLPDGMILQDGVFQGCRNLTRVTVCGSVGAEDGYSKIVTPDCIPNDTFKGCSQLQTVEMRYGVKTVGADAFADCKSLQQITLPESLQSIKHRAFNNCVSLKRLTIPDSVVEICANPIYRSDTNQVFSGCAFDELVVGRGCKNDLSFLKCVDRTKRIVIREAEKIENRWFSGMKYLQEVDLPNCLRVIGEGAFSDCASLRKIVIPNSVTAIEKYAFANCEGLTDAVISDSVEKIGEGAFVHCIGLRNIQLGRNVKFLGYRAFAECKSLEQITLPKSIFPWDHGRKYGDGRSFDIFTVCHALKAIYVPCEYASTDGEAYRLAHDLQVEYAILKPYPN